MVFFVSAAFFAARSILFLRRLRCAAARREASARFGAAGSRGPHLPGTGLQDAVRDLPERAQQRFLGHVLAERVRAGDGPGDGYPCPRRLLELWWRHCRTNPMM